MIGFPIMFQAVIPLRTCTDKPHRDPYRIKDKASTLVQNYNLVQLQD